MKHLCCSRFIFLSVFFVSSLFASLNDKSAIFFYGDHISYPMVGIHDYIVVEPDNINQFAHGFSVYKDKMYARIAMSDFIGKKKSLKKLLQREISSLIQQGFTNIFLDANDVETHKGALATFINSFHKQYPQYKLILNSDFDLLDAVAHSIEAIVIESYMDEDVEDLLAYNLDILNIEYVDIRDLKDSMKMVKKIKNRGMIPYITTEYTDIYGKSSKNAIKREIFTLINTIHESKLPDAHQNGALSLEYLGYIQKLHQADVALPDPVSMTQYAGVVIWLNQEYSSPIKLIQWVLSLDKFDIKVTFVNNFGFDADAIMLNKLGINITEGKSGARKKRKTIIERDDMIGFEIEPSLSNIGLYLDPKSSKALLTFKDINGLKSTPSAITPWGGYAMAESFMLELHKENIWIIDPFKFFAQTLRLETLLVPDTSTENGRRLFFSHIDGDGIMSYYESNPELVSGDTVLSDILIPYKVPHSVSLIGAEILPDGLYPELSERMIEIGRKMYALDNVEGASHTFTHPFYWNKIIDGKLDRKYRLKPKGYEFSMSHEFDDLFVFLNDLKPTHREKIETVFWSGDCKPPERVLKYIAERGINNINGGDTTIMNSVPWIARIAPLGYERGDYYQIYTGATNENVYTNDWLGPFWGFKKAVQTFKLTNSPRRFKPIDIYYHLYSGSKLASLNALKYNFEWSMKQDVMPIFTSAFVPKVKDYFTVSMAKDGDNWLVDGMHDLKTLRIEKEGASVKFKKSKSTMGIKHFENHTYLNLDRSKKHFITTSEDDSYKKSSYLISSNAKIVDFKRTKRKQMLSFDGDVELEVSFHLTKKCKLKSIPKESRRVKDKRAIHLYYKDIKKATLNVSCR
ncbi:MAG: hypothetical protein U9P38_02405 [Campylobacterota bacterium]|nr:hypothetical protein [Campylobacterota bacterium]